MTTEEIVLAAATDVTIVMQPQLDKADKEQFVQFFVQKATELLEEKERVDILIQSYAIESAEVFSGDIQTILQFVEKETKRKYSFRKGRLLIYFTKEYGTGVWEDD